MAQEDVPIAFFSYCREDSEFALKLAEDLKVAGAHVWIDQLDIEPGTPWDRAVEEALTSSPRMLVVLSPVSVNSDNVRDEVSFALSRQKRVIPVLYRDCNIPFRLARLQHIDFRPDYARALTILVRALGVGQAAHSHAASGASAAVAVVAVSTTEIEETVLPQNTDEERRIATEKAELEEAHRVAAQQARLQEQERERKAAEEKARQNKLEEDRRLAIEQARLDEERKAAAEQAVHEQRERERQATEENVRQEMSRREQRAAEQARLEEEARHAAERARHALEEQERQAAEIRARQEQLRREQQESVERAKFDFAVEPERIEAVAVEQLVVEVERIEPAHRAPVEQPRASAANASVVPPQRPRPTQRNFASPKYLAGGAIAVAVVALMVFLLAGRGSHENASEKKGAESKAAETAAVQQPQTQVPDQQTPPAPSSPGTQSAAAPSDSSNPDQTNDKAQPPAADAASAAKAKNPAPSIDTSVLNPAGDRAAGTKLSAANPANAANTAAAPDRVRVSQGVSQGWLIHEVKPDYPPLARQAHVQGQVVLNVVIAKNGTIKTITAQKSGHPWLIPAAINAVKQWRYQPYKVDGKPVEVDTQVFVKFTLTN